MRVITGTARGVPLKAPEGLATRPTADKVKQAVFNMIQYEVFGDVLDLFAGSGQLGIEALSRGAAFCDFVDVRGDAVSVVRENLKKTRLDAQAQVWHCDYKTFLARTRRNYRLIFLDPPYAEKALENALKHISEIDILAEGGIIVTERPFGKALDEHFSGLVRLEDHCYGKTCVSLFRREGERL